VPIHFLNEEIAIGVKEGGKVSRLMTEMEVVCLPKNLPEYLEIDIADLELDGLRYISDLPLPEGVEIPALAQGDEANRPIVSIHIIKEVVIEEEEEVLEEGLELAEGEEPAEGEAPEGEAPAADEPKEE
jgi:large subunit ribosomal protein L25